MLLLKAEKEVRHFSQKLHVQLLINLDRGAAKYPNIRLLPDPTPPFFSFPTTFKIKNKNLQNLYVDLQWARRETNPKFWGKQ
jgi:hypothetical protein